MIHDRRLCVAALWPGHARQCLLAAMLGGLLVLPQAQAQTSVPLDMAGAAQCEVRGFAIDRDPKGTNVRSAPRANASVIGRLVPMICVDKDEYSGVEFDIVGFKVRLVSDQEWQR